MKQRIQDVELINGEADFHKHGWASNRTRVVEDIHEEDKLEQNKKTNLCDEE